MAKKQKIVMYTKPTCSKCRYALSYLQERSINPETIEYLINIPTLEDLQELIQKLKVDPIAIVRTNEPLYIEKFKGKKMSELQLLKMLVKHPGLLQRPILVKGNQAVIGRSDEALEKII